jgi:hypothetical protein
LICGVAQWPVSIAFVQLSLALAHNHDGLILTWEGHGQGRLLCRFKVENRSSSAQYLGNSDTESRTWRTVMMAAFNKHRRSRNLCRCKCSGNADWGRGKRKHCILMERLYCSCALVRVRGGTSSMAVSLNREPGLEHQQPRNVLADYYLMPETEAEGGLLPCFCHV